MDQPACEDLYDHLLNCLKPIALHMTGMLRQLGFRTAYDRKVMYYCQTCRIGGTFELCHKCAEEKHWDHDLEHVYTNRICSCNDSTLLSLIKYLWGIETEPHMTQSDLKMFKDIGLSQNRKTCSFTNKETGFTLQSEYKCYTCNLDSSRGVCYACITQCHKDHEISYVRYGYFTCECGKRGKSFCKSIGETTSTKKKPTKRNPHENRDELRGKPTSETERGKRRGAGMYRAFECPVCTVYMSAPIHMCERGHSICSVCVTRMNECPLCRGPMASARNLGLEELGQMLTITCKDCDQEFSVATINHHRKECRMKDHDCPLWETCAWRGKFWSVYDHCKEQHREYVLEGPSHIFLVANCAEDRHKQVKLIRVEEDLFVFTWKYDRRRHTFCAAVHYFGQEDKTSAFEYSLHVISPNSKDSRVFRKMASIRHETSLEELNGIAIKTIQPSSHGSMGLLIYKLTLQHIPVNQENSANVHVHQQQSS